MEYICETNKDRGWQLRAPLEHLPARSLGGLLYTFSLFLSLSCWQHELANQDSFFFFSF